MAAVRDIFALTTFTVPDGEEFPPEPSWDVPEQWKSVFRPLDHSDSCLRASIGRGIEHPEKGIIITGRVSPACWCCHDENTRSVASFEAWREHEAALARLLKSPHQTVQLEMNGNMVLFYNRLRSSRAEIITVDFPKGHRQSIGDKICKVRGMRLEGPITSIDSANDPLFRARVPYHAGPHSGWVIDRVPSKTDIDQAIWICTWISEERETRFKTTQTRTESGFPVGIYENEDGSDEVAVPVEKFFEQQLKDRGALAISKEHFQMHHSFPTVRK